MHAVATIIKWQSTVERAEVTRDDHASAWTRQPIYVTLQGPTILEAHNSAGSPSSIGTGACMECLFAQDELVGNGEIVLLSSGSCGRSSVEYVKPSEQNWDSSTGSDVEQSGSEASRAHVLFCPWRGLSLQLTPPCYPAFSAHTPHSTAPREDVSLRYRCITASHSHMYGPRYSVRLRSTGISTL